MGTKLLIVILFVLSILTSSALTYLMINKSGHTSTNGNLKEELSKLIQENPEIIIDALRKAQTAKAEQDENKSAEAAGKLRPQLENSATDGQTGKKDADVVMVGFIDYNCGYCRKSEPDIEKLLLEDANLKFVMKDFPILGPLSVEKSKASIAIAKIAPEKWYDFYKDLNRSNTQSVDQVIELAQSKLGIDANLLKSEMESKETQNKLAENRSIGEQLAISGTPVFIRLLRFNDGQSVSRDKGHSGQKCCDHD